MVSQVSVSRFKNVCNVISCDVSLNRNILHWITNIQILCLTAILNFYSSKTVKLVAVVIVVVVVVAIVVVLVETGRHNHNTETTRFSLSFSQSVQLNYRHIK